MAGRIKGITIEIDGNATKLEKALQDVNDTSRKLQNELRDVDRLLKFDPENVEALTQKQKLLNEQIENTSKKLEQLQAVEQQIEEQFRLGQISEQQFRAFRREIEFTQRQLGNLEESLEQVNRQNLRGIRRAFAQVADAAREVQDEVKEIGTIAGGIGAGVAGGAIALTQEYQEFNEVLARLRTNAQMTGRDVGLVEDAFGKIVAITGEADAAGETLANLMASGLDDNQLAEMIDLTNGAYIRFSDTLKTEGIADGIQETFATGKAVGPFAELLERSGVSLEEFDKKLGAAKTTSEKTNVIMQAMRDQGFAGVTEKYREMNPEVQRSAEANASLQKSLGELAIVFAPIVAEITNLLTKIVEWAAKNPELMQQLFAIGAAIGIVVGACMALAPVFAVITGLAGFFGASIATVSVALLGIVAVIAAVVLACIWLYKNWDMVSAKAKEIAASMLKAFNEWKEGVKQRFNDTINDIKRLWNNVIQFFKGIDLKQVGKDIISGLISGIGSMASNLYNKAKELADSVGKTLKKALKIGSPSKVTEEIGEFTGEGIEVGLANKISNISAMSKKLAAAAVPKMPEIKMPEMTAAQAAGKNLTVNIHSPKALDIREANREFNRTINKMSLLW